ncbi:hypothetical protein RE474_11945 [Methanolobus sediminis]|uniref:HD domain-containing protein n=1 Tax=Methanolobus sediminis TaxID=3072978 RepID=A0AA51YLQ6_9EURY|nr:hypothetical protein [Methanolobus sediminis]WMW24778.1 hypothetical protein RE474_11945 [Methanolobus sediminis]
MENSNNIQIALEIMMKAHKNQLDNAGNPYILHPIAVMIRLENEGNYPHTAGPGSSWMECARITALWHDIAEDTPWSIEKLMNEAHLDLPEESLHDIETSLRLLTHLPDVPYMDYINNIIAHAPECNGIPLYIKKADLEHNTLPSRLDFMKPEEKERRFNKYNPAIKLITETIEEFEKSF